MRALPTPMSNLMSGSSSEIKEESSAKSSLDEQLLVNRLPSVQHVGAPKDDSPSSVAKGYTTIMRKKTEPNSINTTPTTAYSSSSSSQSTRGNNDPAFRKLQHDFGKRLEKPFKAQQRHPPQERIRSVQNRGSPEFSRDTGILLAGQGDSDSDSSSSSAALDSFLDSRIQRLLDSPKNANNSLKPLKSPYQHHDGTPEEPVDLAHPERFRNKTDNPSSPRQEPKQQHYTPPRRSSFPRPAPPAQKPLSPNHDHHGRTRPLLVSSAYHSSTGNLYIPNPKPTLTTLTTVGDHSLGRGASFFNPLGASPGKNSAQSTYRDYRRNAHAIRQESEANGDDESSLDSLEVLEIWSKQIRAELRNEAMRELAMEAEQAAEAGEERFSSSRPWTMGNDSQELSSPLRRNRSYSEGMTPTKQQPNRSILRLRRIPKVPVRELRNVNEVFPDLDVFHKNLRTHCARNKVDRSCLVFNEQVNKPLIDFTAMDAAIASVGTMSPKSASSSKEASFLDTFSFEMLKQSFSKDTQGGEEGRIGIGDILAEHIRPVDCEYKAPPKQEVPPGLEKLKIDLSPRAKTTPPKPAERKELDINPSPVQTMSQSTEDRPAPRSLFNNPARQAVSKANSIDGDEIYIDYAKLAKTPQLEHTNPDFVTPARLRRIRGKESLAINSVLQTVPSILESASPHRRHLNQFDPSSPEKNDSTVTELLLPTLPLTLGREADANNDLQTITHNGSQPQRLGSSSLDDQESHSDVESQQRQSFGKRRTRISIFSKRQTVTEKEKDAVPLLSKSQEMVIATKKSVDIETDGQPPKEISTPAYHDCTCLSIHDDCDLDEIAIPDPPPNSKDATSDFSNSGGSPRPFRAAMKILADHLSPARSDGKANQSLFVPIKQNDDFMQNFLYCGKRLGPSDQIDPRVEICSDPCQQGRCEDAIAAAASTCYASFVLDDPDVDTNDSAAITTKGSQSLFRKGFGQRVDAETWFDVATEKVDGVIERLVGTDTPQNPWNVSFQPPSLRKNSEAAKKYTSSQQQEWQVKKLDLADEMIQEPSISPSNSSTQLSTKSGSRASSPVVALFPAPDRSLTGNDRFQVMYDHSIDFRTQRSSTNSKHESKNSLLDGSKAITDTSNTMAND